MEKSRGRRSGPECLFLHLAWINLLFSHLVREWGWVKLSPFLFATVEFSWCGQWTTFCSLGIAEVPQSAQLRHLWVIQEGNQLNLTFLSIIFFPCNSNLLREVCGEQESGRAWGECWDQDLPFPRSPNHSYSLEHPENYLGFFTSIVYHWKKLQKLPLFGKIVVAAKFWPPRLF